MFRNAVTQFSLFAALAVVLGGFAVGVTVVFAQEDPVGVNPALPGASAAAGQRRDEVVLRSGHVIFGSVVEQRTGPQNSAELEVTLADGSKLILQRDQFRTWKAEAADLPEYRARLEQGNATVESQWALADWCREKKLKQEAEVHARIVLEMDPEHEGARRLLGHQNIRGRWQDPDEEQRRQGKVKVNNLWLLPEIVQISQALEEYNAKQVEWKKNLRLWLREASRPGRGREQAIERLRNTRDPEAVEALVEFITETKPSPPSIEQRDWLLEALCGIPTLASSYALLDYYMTVGDHDEGRDRAIRTLGRRPEHKPQLARRLVAELDIDKLGDRSKLTDRGVALSNQRRLERAATGLRLIDVKIGIEPLIVSLRVPYTLKTRIQDGASNVGGNVTGFGGGGRELNETFVLENLSAVETLQAFTGQRFGNNQDAWMRWWIDANTPANLDLSRDQ